MTKHKCNKEKDIEEIKESIGDIKLILVEVSTDLKHTKNKLDEDHETVKSLNSFKWRAIGATSIMLLLVGLISSVLASVITLKIKG